MVRCKVPIIFWTIFIKPNIFIWMGKKCVRITFYLHFLCLIDTAFLAHFTHFLGKQSFALKLEFLKIIILSWKNIFIWMCEDYTQFIFFMSHKYSIFISLYPLFGQAELWLVPEMIPGIVFWNSCHKMRQCPNNSWNYNNGIIENNCQDNFFSCMWNTWQLFYCCHNNFTCYS